MRIEGKARFARPCLKGSLLAFSLLAATQGQAQRSSENAVTAAEDAFGISIGAETIGLYDSSRVRGFSPTVAGNVRIDGLYFDEVWGLNGRLRQSITIRVGLSTLGFPFPSPTGVVDYALRRPGDDPSASGFASIDSYGSAYAELDTVLPVDERLSLGAGAALSHEEYQSGADGHNWTAGLSALWRPGPDTEIQPFWSAYQAWDYEVSSIYIPAGAFLPPRTRRREFKGPDWARFAGSGFAYGLVARHSPSPDWLVRGGLFRSGVTDQEDAANLLTELTREGDGRQLIIVDPRVRTASTSGELRLTRSLRDGPRLHNLHLALRGRRRSALYGGSDLIDLGLRRLDEQESSPEPAFSFTEQSRDRVRQWTAGLAYEGRWQDVGELSLGLQRTRYRKTVLAPDQPAQTARSSPWLYNGTLAVEISPKLHAYAGFARGLEESGVAPDNATNRGEPLAAILTQQRDLGLRWAIAERLRLIAGLFEVRKPYFNLDASGRFTLLGDVRHRGIEVSVSGPVTPRLNIVAGAVLLQPRVTGDGVALGRVGRLPLDQPGRTFRLNAAWQAPGLDGLSLELGLAYSSRRAATRDNLVFLPGQALLNLAARYRFRLYGNDATLRVQASNLLDHYYFALRGSGAYGLTPGRILSATLAVDF